MLTPLIATSLAAVPAPQDATPQTVEERLDALEADRDRLSSELDAALDALAAADAGLLGAPGDVDTLDDSTMEAWANIAGRALGPRAANVYTAKDLAFGGYGEFLGEVFEGRDGDRFDALRWVMYFGNRFSDRWLFNSEIEIEHGSTSASSATTGSGGSVSIEFAYIDHLLTNSVALRGGVVLVPLGFINERHEPTTFLASARPQTEQRIIPSTWRATGIGGYGQAGDFAWRAYAINSLNGNEFDANGVRGGRQKGNRASIDTVSFAARVDYVGTPGMTAGVSAYSGDAVVDMAEDMRTTIVDLHFEYNTGPWNFRALYAMSDVDNTAGFNAATGENVASEMTGWYAEAAFDVLSLWDRAPNQTLDVFVRYEDIDTQAELEPGFTASGGVVDTFTTLGVNYKPLNQVVLKADYTFLDEGDDVVRFLIGYAF